MVYIKKKQNMSIFFSNCVFNDKIALKWSLQVFKSVKYMFSFIRLILWYVHNVFTIIFYQKKLFMIFFTFLNSKNEALITIGNGTR
jgi:hypothetical protein